MVLNVPLLSQLNSELPMNAVFRCPPVYSFISLSAIALAAIAAIPSSAQEKLITDPPPYTPAIGTQQDLGAVELTNPESLLGGIGGSDENDDGAAVNPYSLHRGTTLVPNSPSPVPGPSKIGSPETEKVPLTQF
jgi:hypothetical protein